MIVLVILFGIVEVVVKTDELLVLVVVTVVIVVLAAVVELVVELGREVKAVRGQPIIEAANLLFSKLSTGNRTHGVSYQSHVKSEYSPGIFSIKGTVSPSICSIYIIVPAGANNFSFQYKRLGPETKSTSVQDKCESLTDASANSLLAKR